MRKLLLSAAFIVSCGVAHAQPFYTVPPAYESVVGGSTFLGPLSNAYRRYQMLIHASQLTGLVGQQLNGITWRLGGSATSNSAALSYSSYEIYSATSTFNNNIVGGLTQVRSGALELPAGALQATGTPRVFGTRIGFDPYTYTGGNLVIELVHSAATGTSTSVDAIGTSVAGYGTNFRAYWTSTVGSATGSNGNFAVTGLSTVPEPATMLALGAGVSTLLLRRRRKA
jgi:hypothetical protein